MNNLGKFIGALIIVCLLIITVVLIIDTGKSDEPGSIDEQTVFNPAAKPDDSFEAEIPTLPPVPAQTEETELPQEPGVSVILPDDETPLDSFELTETVDELTAEQINAIMRDMTAEEKIYQLFFVSPEGLTGVDIVSQAGNTTKTAIETHPVGGIVYSSRNFISFDQSKKMIDNTIGFTKYPLVLLAPEGSSPVKMTDLNLLVYSGDLTGKLSEIGISPAALNPGSTGFTDSEYAKAIKDGADIILFPRDMGAAYGAIRTALNSGALSAERLDEAVFRILLAKINMGLISSRDD